MCIYSFGTMNRCGMCSSRSEGKVEYRHTNGEILVVRISTAGMWARRIWIANLPPEVSDGVLQAVLSRYGEERDIQVETWSRLYRYTVANDIRIAMITLAKYIPSHITVAGRRVLVSRWTTYDVLWLCSASCIVAKIPHDLSQQILNNMDSKGLQ